MRLGIEKNKGFIFAVLIRKTNTGIFILKKFKKEGGQGLSQIKREIPWFGVKTIISVPRQQVFCKEMSVDRNLSYKEIRLYIQKMLSKINFSTADLNFDFEVINQNTKTQQLRITAIEKRFLEGFLSEFKGFSLIAVDVDEFAKTRGLASKISIEAEYLTSLGLALWGYRDEP